MTVQNDMLVCIKYGTFVRIVNFFETALCNLPHEQQALYETLLKELHATMDKVHADPTEMKP